MEYELHITMEPPTHKSAHHTLTMGWTYSEIEGDPMLGVGKRGYATRHYHAGTPRKTVKDSLDKGMRYLEAHGETVVRGKIEVVILDILRSKK